MRRTVAVVLAAGLGTRMKSATPKVLHRICGRPLVDYVIDAAVTATGSRPLVVYSPATDAVRDAVAERADAALQDVPRGTGDALVSISDPGDQGNVAPGASVPTPQLSEGDRWSGLCHAPDGTAYLVSEQGRVAVRPAAER